MPYQRDDAPAHPPGAQRWLAQGGAVESGRLAESIAGDPAAREVRRLAPDLVVLLATPERAEELKAEFAADLVMEQDAPLTPPG